jgi:hypothetical protein
MVETHLPGRWEASYTTFTGNKTDTIRASAAQTLVLDYEVEVDKGELTIELRRHEGGPLWDMSFQEDAADSVAIALPDTGPHTLAIEGEGAGGSFDLSWELE